MKRIVVAAADLHQEPAIISALAPLPNVVVTARCVDAAMLLDQVRANDASTVVLSDGLPNLSPTIVREARANGVDVIGVGAGELPGVSWVDIASGFEALLERVNGARASTRGGVWQVPRTDVTRGKLIAVWGPTGAPGRTTIATALAAEYAEHAHVLLVDADPFGGSIAVNLGIAEDASGVAIACTQALRGTLTTDTMRRIPRALTDRLAVITGIHQVRRWPELAAIDELWDVCREMSEIVIADLGFCLEDQEDIGRRTQSTLSTLERADLVVAVASADPVGMLRLLNDLPNLEAVAPNAHIVVVVNKVRKAAMSSAAVHEACASAEVAHPVVCVPFDDAACAAALTSGSLLSPRSAIRTTLRQARAVFT